MSYPGRLAASAVAIALAVVACSSDVTQSEEFQALESDYQTLESQREDLASSLADLETELEASKEEVKGLQSRLADAESRTADAATKVEELETALEAETNRIEPYPQELKDLFVDGCALDDPTMGAACVCTIEQIQTVMPLADFFLVSLAFEQVQFDPTTGEPDASFFEIEGADVFMDVLFDCLFDSVGSSG